MRVLVGCGFSGRVRDAFVRTGHDAMSCDLLSSESPGKHFQGDIRELLNEEWDLLIANISSMKIVNIYWNLIKSNFQVSK